MENIFKKITGLPDETEWVEFKLNYKHPEDIGEYISALSNSAALHEKPNGYICWGIEDKTHKIKGTDFKPKAFKVGNEELENWLARLLSPRIDFRILEEKIEGQNVSLIVIPSATHVPVRFKGEAFIRVGSYKKRLKDFPEKEKNLWALFSQQSFEDGIALENVDSDTVLKLLDYPTYFDMTGKPLPDNRTGILERLKKENFIMEVRRDVFDITNLGSILFAKDLSDFKNIARKALRIIIYKDETRINTIREQTDSKGYAVGFSGAVSFINDSLPQNEQIENAFRKQMRRYPEIAIRELVANTIIHQDFNIGGTGPMVEIFTDRIEITNPGKPLINTLRFIDEPPRSRNESLASFMRRINICEERGSGIDKVIFSVELFQLPAPDFIVTESHTKAILYAPRPFKNMSRDERIRACYQHACLQYVSNKEMTNTSLRARFNISEKNYPMVSKVISDSIKAGFVKLKDPENKSKKHAKYVPFWF